MPRTAARRDTWLQGRAAAGPGCVRSRLKSGEGLRRRPGLRARYSVPGEIRAHSAIAARQVSERSNNLRRRPPLSGSPLRQRFSGRRHRPRVSVAPSGVLNAKACSRPGRRPLPSAATGEPTKPGLRAFADSPAVRVFRRCGRRLPRQAEGALPLRRSDRPPKAESDVSRFSRPREWTESR